MFCRNCGQAALDGALHCRNCALPLDWMPLRREGRDLVVWKGAELPPFCVKCGAAACQPSVRKRFAWHSPALYLLILADILIYAPAYAIERKRFDLAVPLCDAHLARRSVGLVVARLLMAVGLAGLALALPFDHTRTGLLACVASFLVGLFAFAVVNPILRPSRISTHHAVFRGAHDAFLRRLPTEAPATFA